MKSLILLDNIWLLQCSKHKESIKRTNAPTQRKIYQSVPTFMEVLVLICTCLTMTCALMFCKCPGLLLQTLIAVWRATHHMSPHPHQKQLKCLQDLMVWSRNKNGLYVNPLVQTGGCSTRHFHTKIARLFWAEETIRNRFARSMDYCRNYAGKEK